MPSTQTRAPFLTRLAQSGLLTAVQFAEVEREALADGDTAEKEIARQLVERGLLTRFQAERLLDGRARGFFFDQFKISGLLGVGGMGWVYAAEDTRSGETVALKVLLERLRDDRGMRARFEQEARVGLRLNHPHIVRTIHLGSAGGAPYMVMELVRGATLLEVLRRCRRLSWPLACDVARQAASGLHYAHEQGVIHRDVKPQNLLVDETGRVRLLDFGLSMVREGETGDEFSMAMIFGHQCVGTAEFMAPEQAVDSLAVDARSDVYSLGGTLFAALTGRLPFEARNAVEMLKAHRHTPVPSVRALLPEIPEQLASIVSKMLAKDPAERFASCAEVAAALAEFATPEPLAFDFDAVLAERQRQAEVRLSELSRSQSRPNLSNSTTRPSASSSAAQLDDERGPRPQRSRATQETPSSSAQGAETIAASIDPSGAAGIPRAVDAGSVLVDLKTGRELPLLKDKVTLGRSADCDLSFPDPAVSSRHCELLFDGREWWLTDLSSRNGTRVAGALVKYYALKPGEEFVLGNELRLRLKYRREGGTSHTGMVGRNRALVVFVVVLASTLLLILAWFIKFGLLRK